MRVSNEAIFLVTNVISKKGWIDLPAQGTSMFPFIRRGDICRFVSCEPAALRKGDIVLFTNSSGQLVAHRFYYTIRDENRTQYIFKGDSNLNFDQPINQEQLIGKMISIQKNLTQFPISHFFAVTWSKLIISIPILSRLSRIYVSWRNSL